MSSTVLITFDIEEVFQIEAARGHVTEADCAVFPDRLPQQMEALFSILAAANAKATFFTLGTIAEKYPKVIKQIVEAGHELACHGYSHQRLFVMGEDQSREDTKKAKDILEQVGGVSVQGFRAPTWSVNHQTPWVADLLLELGFTYDSSIQPVRHPQYGVVNAPRTPSLLKGQGEASIPELPPLTLQRGKTRMAVAGGGYFRLYPLGFMLKGIKQMQAMEAPSVLYFHPWEFDPDQPKLPLPLLQRMRTYIGINKTQTRLKQLLEKHEGMAIATWLEAQDVSAWPSFKV